MSLNMVVIIIAILLVLYGVINPLLRKQEKAEHQLLQKSKESKESVSYARHIQDAILPKESEFSGAFSEVFILNQPKDIVSGDILWSHKRGNKTFVALLDCTGHGVLGAFITFLAYDALNRIVVNEKIESPTQVLERLDTDLKGTLMKEANHGYMHGLDIGFCLFDFDNMILTYSGARHQMLMINGELNLTKGNRRSIGQNFRKHLPGFTEIELAFSKTDNFYLWTDGIPDQFGGPNDKKLSAKRLISMLDDVSGYTLAQQKKILSYKIDQWIKNREQVDDIFLVGLRA